jgi:hypothetical protein
MKHSLVKKYVELLLKSGKISLDKSHRVTILIELHQGGIRSIDETVTEKIK